MRPVTLVSVSAWLLSASAADIQFQQSLIPDIDIKLPIFSLGSPAIVPQDLLVEFINNTAPGVVLQGGNTDSNKTLYAHDGNRLVALFNQTTGEAKIFPTFSNLQPANSINTDAALDYIKNEEIFPKDDTILGLTTGSGLFGSTHHNNTTPTSPKQYLAHVQIQRNVTVSNRIYPVCGPGSTASFGFAADGKVHSLAYQWKPAKLSGRTLQASPAVSIYQNILKQLESQAPTASVTVDSVDVCFYDSGVDYIQPVYRFTGSVFGGPDNSTKPLTAGIVGYIPIADSSPEAIPDLNNPAQRPAPSSASSSNSSDPIQKRGPQIKIGRYIDRNDTSQWYINSWNFLDALRASQDTVFNFNPVDFIDSQYLYITPAEVTTDKEYYINSVHIADIETHGGWNEFTTFERSPDYPYIVHLSDIPSSGYGPGAGGSLAYWILHSCEVIPTPEDFPNQPLSTAFAPWWPIFNGLHAVVGYRTEMTIADSVMPEFGSAIGAGAGFVSSWLMTVSNDRADYVPPVIDFDNFAGFDQPRGRAAAVAVCGHEDDVATDVENLGRPDCLTMWWYENSCNCG